MILLKIFDIRETMAWLLMKDGFDRLLLEEAQVTTFARLSFQGRRNMEWYDPEERERYLDMPEYIYWKEAKSFLFSYIKGKKTPSHFQISLRLSREEAERRLGQQIAGQDVDFLLHFRFEQGKLSAVTGCSYHNFTMDKQAEFAWDGAAQEMLRELQIGFEAVS